MGWGIKRCSVGGEPEEFADHVAVELPLEIVVDDVPLVALMRLPGMDEELAVGFCLTERVIDDISRIKLVRHREKQSGGSGGIENRAGSGNGRRKSIELVLESSHEGDGFSAPRMMPTGYGRVDSLAVMERPEAKITSRLRVTERVIFSLGDTLTGSQEVFQDTAGAHGAGIFTASGELVVAVEDVGRHNALDKAVGWCALRGISLTDKVLFNSGRLSCAMTLKAVRMGIPVLVSMAAPTSLVLCVAEEAGLTVIGFSNGRKFSVYTHHERIVP